MKHRGPRKLKNRDKTYVLSMVVKFALERWWPTAAEMSRFVARGSRWLWARDFNELVFDGLMNRKGYRWYLTLEGFARAGIDPFVPPRLRPPAAQTKSKRTKGANRLRRVKRLDAFEVYERAPSPKDDRFTRPQNHGVKAPWLP